MNLQMLRLYWIGFNYSLLILVDSIIVGSSDFVRYSETSHHVNFIVVYSLQQKGEDFVYFQ